MKGHEQNSFVKLFLFAFAICFCFKFYSQTNIPNPSIFKPNPDKESKYLPYLAVRHGNLETIDNWKKNNTVQYYQELWYFCESFYIKRNYFNEGIVLDESMIDITRFDSQRKENEETIVIMPGMKDVIVLLPQNKLLFKPQY